MTRHVPHRAAPRANPAARRPPAAVDQLPVFIDRSGLRRRTLQGMALVVGCACLGYLVFVGTLVGGLLQPVGTRPPGTGVPASAARDAPGTDTSGQAHADRDDRRRPPTGRSAPPPAGDPGR
ncbi:MULTISPECIES: hypothetical protein [Streptomyces]